MTFLGVWEPLWVALALCSWAMVATLVVMSLWALVDLWVRGRRGRRNR